MPEQILPVTGLDQVGVILDTPPTILPPNAFSDARNVRFRDGAVRKMEGDVEIFPGIFKEPYVDKILANTTERLKYVAWWPNPNLADNQKGYYLVIIEDTVRNRDVAYLVEPGADDTDAATRVEKGDFTVNTQASWQHSFFQGGFALIINNGRDKPHYILDLDGNEDINAVPDLAPLPGWDSYMFNEVAYSDTVPMDIDDLIFNFSQPYSENTYIVSEVTYNDTELIVGSGGYTVLMDETSTEIIGVRINSEQVMAGDLVVIRIETKNPVFVRAGVVRAFSDFLVAGNLIEIDTDTGETIRNLPGIVRTSDVAAPGNIPNNWNPFAGGVSTADEIIVSDTGVVQDMVELQGNLYIYSNNSISVLRKTGNAAIPVTIAPVTTAYGAQTTDAVLEYDGKHVVVGSEDIYIFGGHPGSIQSIADGRVRRFFFNDLNPLHEERMFTLRYQQKDEIWICYPSTSSLTGECDKALIWNYRQNNWTLRDLRNVVAGDVGPIPGGGVPGAEVEFNGASGNRGVIQLGNFERQLMIIDTESDLINMLNMTPHTHQLTITVDSSAGVGGNGPFIWDLTIGPDFNSGTSGDTDALTPLALTFILSKDNVFAPGFPISVVLDDNTTTAREIRDKLVTNTDFNNHFVVKEDPLNEDSDITIYVKGLSGEQVDGFRIPEYDFGSLTINSIIKSELVDLDRDQLQAIPDCDIAVSNNGFIDTESETDTYLYTVGINVPANCVTPSDPILYFVDIDTDKVSNADLGSVGLRIQLDTDDALMYDQVENSVFYADSSRGGLVQRPYPSFLNENNPDHQIMFKLGDINTTSVTLPWEPTVSGNYFITIELDGDTDGVTPQVDTDAFKLSAYRAGEAPAVDTDYVLTMRASGPDPMNADTDVFNTGIWEFQDSDTDFTQTPRPNLVVPIYKNSGVNEVALLIKDFINNDTEINVNWTADANGNVVTVYGDSENTQWQYIEPLNPIYSVNDINYGYNPPRMADVVTPRFIIDGPAIEPFEYALAPEDSDIASETIIKSIGNAGIGVAEGWVAIPITSEPAEQWTQLTLTTQRSFYDTDWSVRLNYVGNTRNVATGDPRLGDSTGFYREFNPEFATLTHEDSEVPYTFNKTNQVFTYTDEDVDGTHVREGSYFNRATPTIFAFKTRNGSVETGRELIVFQVGNDSELEGDYNPNDGSGTNNGARIQSVAAANEIVAKLRNANRRLNIVYIPDSNEFEIVPVNYNELATFILEIAINDSPEGVERIRKMFRDSEGLIHNTHNIAALPTRNPEDTEFRQASFGPDVSNISKDLTFTLADLGNTSDILTTDFNVDRPWQSDQINPNKHYPIFATTISHDNDTENATGVVYQNKVVGADVGWSQPVYSILSADSEATEPYESYFERIQIALTPEFNTEGVHGFAVLADGSYKPELDASALRNRLEMRIQGSEYPGDLVSFDTEFKTEYSMNTFNIGDDYKMDIRIHGRFINLRVTDDVTTDNPDPTLYNEQSEWNVAGIQMEYAVTGRR